MLSKIAVKIDSLSKIYKLYDSRYDRMKEFFNPFKKVYHKNHHALKNISLDIKKGEVLGVIGKNGTGKSTLLKILASVVTPTSGNFVCNGKVAALIELSGGFNVDLTGIENIYFLGAIQGFKKKEIDNKLQDILDFADIGEYIYQPVRTYSSGMHVRLAFSIAINIDPEILLTDEVLAVGDVRFQKKCYRKIQNFKDAGKTIVICTHSMPVVKDYCTKAVWLNEGVISAYGDPEYVTDSYLAYMNACKPHQGIKKISTETNYPALEKPMVSIPDTFKNIDWVNLEGLRHYGDGGAYVSHASLINLKEKKTVYRLRGNEEVSIMMIASIERHYENPGVQLLFHNRFGSAILKVSSYVYQQNIKIEAGKVNIISFDFKMPALGNGNYSISIAFMNKKDGIVNHLYGVNDAILFEIANPNPKFKQNTILVLDRVNINLVEQYENN